jgi:hypothetical protein
MTNNSAVFYSFCLYILYVLLPLVPAMLIFKFFPETKVTVSGPLQNLTVNATGAFAAYVVTVALGFFMVNYVEHQIQWSTHYAVAGVISNLGQNEGFNSDQFYSRYNLATVDMGGRYQVRDYSFVILLNHPVSTPETVCLNYWGDSGPGGGGAPPLPKRVPIVLLSTTDAQRFRIQAQNGQVAIVPEVFQSQRPQIAMQGVQPCE